MKEEEITVADNEFVAEIKHIINSVRQNAVRSVDFCRGFSVRQLEMCRQFYRTYPNANTLCAQLNWSQYANRIEIH